MSDKRFADGILVPVRYGKESDLCWFDAFEFISNHEGRSYSVFSLGTSRKRNTTDRFIEHRLSNSARKNFNEPVEQRAFDTAERDSFCALRKRGRGKKRERIFDDNIREMIIRFLSTSFNIA